MHFVAACCHGLNATVKLLVDVGGVAQTMSVPYGYEQSAKQVEIFRKTTFSNGKNQALTTTSCRNWFIGLSHTGGGTERPH